MKPSYNILVVDDEATHSMLISELLKKAGYSVASASDGFKALAACKVKVPDVIVLDLHMPMMGGMEVYNRLRAEEKTSGIPIIFMGARDKALPALKADEFNSEDVLLKPFAPNELLARVKGILKERALKEELKKKEGQLKELSLTDPMTSLKTPRYLTEFLKAEVLQARRYNVPLSIVVLEIDNHKDLAKTIGQKAADSVVTQLSVILTRQMRDSDIIARTGVYDFTIVLTCTDKNGAIEVAERLRTKIMDSTFTVGDGTVNVTVTVGICQFVKDMDGEGKILLSHAKAAVNQGHASGGNVSLLAE